MSDLVTVEKSKCIKCGACAASCPVRVIGFKQGAYPYSLPWAAKACIRCGHCVAVCPHSCLIHAEIPVGDCEPIKESRVLSREQALQFFKSRRSIRAFREDEVGMDLVKALVGVAAYAPSGHNSRGLSFHVVSGAARVKELSDGVVEWMTRCVDEGAPIATALSMKGILLLLRTAPDLVLRGAPCVVVAYAGAEDRMAPASATIAIAHMELAAPVYGLGACWAGFLELGFTHYAPLRRKLGLPEGQVPLKALMLGLPKYRYKAIPPRKLPAITTQEES